MARKKSTKVTEKSQPVVEESGAVEDEAPAAGAESVETSPDGVLWEAPQEDLKPAEAGLLMEDQPPSDDGIPTAEECLAKGYSKAQAELIIEACTLMTHGPDYSPVSTEPAYLVSSPRKSGMWRIGRQFSKEPVRLLQSSLTDQECAVLETLHKEGSKHIVVKKVNFQER